MKPLAEAFAVGPANERTAWKALDKYHKQVSNLHLRDLFAGDPKRGERMSAELRAFISTGAA